MFGFVDYVQQVGLCQYLFGEFVYVGCCGWIGWVYYFVVYWIDWVDVIDEVVFQIDWQFFVFVEYVDYVFVCGIVVGQQFVIEQQGLVWFLVGYIFWGDCVQVYVGVFGCVIGQFWLVFQ